MESSKLELICEQYNADSYPELDGEVRIPVGLDEAVLGIDAVSLRLIYSYKKAVEILSDKNSLRHSESNSAVIDLEEIIRDMKGNQYRPIWLRFEGSLQEILDYSNEKYEILRDKNRCATNLDAAAIGFDDESLRIIYSQAGCIKALIKDDGMTFSEAQEFLEFNTFGYSSAERYEPIYCDDEMIDSFADVDTSEREDFIFLAQWSDNSIGDNPKAYKDIARLFDDYEVPQELRVDAVEINYLKFFQWSDPESGEGKELIVRQVKFED